jgi:hypothetical protein
VAYVCMHACVHVCMYVCVLIHEFVSHVTIDEQLGYICMHVCMYVCVLVHACRIGDPLWAVDINSCICTYVCILIHAFISCAKIGEQLGGLYMYVCMYAYLFMNLYLT